MQTGEQVKSLATGAADVVKNTLGLNTTPTDAPVSRELADVTAAVADSVTPDNAPSNPDATTTTTSNPTESTTATTTSPENLKN